MKNQALLTVWCNISDGAGGEIWHWSLSGVKGLTHSWYKVSKSAAVSLYKGIIHSPMFHPGSVNALEHWFSWWQLYHHSSPYQPRRRRSMVRSCPGRYTRLHLKRRHLWAPWQSCAWRWVWGPGSRQCLNLDCRTIALLLWSALWEMFLGKEPGILRKKPSMKQQRQRWKNSSSPRSIMTTCRYGTAHAVPLKGNLTVTRDSSMGVCHWFKFPFIIIKNP